MRYSTQIPEKARSTPNAEAFVKVLDETQLYKNSVIHKASRFYNPVLLTQLPFLRKFQDEFGWPTVPADFPKKILDNMYLNEENVFRLKGSKLGLEYWLRVLTCGDCFIDDSTFFPVLSYIILDDINNGYLSSDIMWPNSMLYLFDGDTSFNPRYLNISIRTPYYNLESLKTYILTHIYKFIGFVDPNTHINIEFIYGPHRKNPHAFYYFEDADEVPVPFLEASYDQAGDNDSQMTVNMNGIATGQWGDSTFIALDFTGGQTHVYPNTGFVYPFRMNLGTFSGTLTTFTITNEQGLYNLKGWFPPTIQTLNLSNNPLFQTVPSMPLAANNVSLQNCNLSGLVLSRVLIELDANGVLAGTVNLSGQATPGGLTPGGIAAKNSLILKGWTITL